MKLDYSKIADKLKQNFSIKGKTTFLIGGTVEYFIEAGDHEEILLAIQFAKEVNLPVYILGRGSDILFPDEHLKAVVINIVKEEIEELGAGEYKVSAGSTLNQMVFKVVKDGWTGPEKLIGIPGGIGGAVWANAGAYGTEISQFVEKVSVINLEEDEATVEFLNNEECLFKYRDSIFKHKNLVIVDVWFKFIEKLEDYNASKEALANAGSTFKNVLVTDEIQKLLGTDFKYNKIPAGWLIEQVGLKGYQIGDAMFSEKHANFVVNLGDAKAQDILDLISLAKDKVKDKFGINIEEELIHIKN
jgi:UDP-N-acetylmuramate dehydrogenase